ncbi:MAG: polysaccharide deacetylase family protein [Solirubrobacteraceae bacterium]
MALTFDDGPDPRWTSPLLDLLLELGAPATFFPIAPRARAHPEIINRMRKEGHEIGLHGALHIDHSRWPGELVEYDTELALELHGDPRPRLWRLPYGKLAPVSVHLARVHELKLVAWSANTEDWLASSTAESMLAAVRGELRPGAVILMHDAIGPRASGDARTERTSCEETLEFVPALVAEIRRRGLEPGPIS